MDLLSQLREACAEVAARARRVSIQRQAIAGYAAALPVPEAGGGWSPDAEAHLLRGSREELAAFWLTLDAINFGSGWFPTLRKRPGRSGYLTVAGGVRDRFAVHGPWSAHELAELTAGEVAAALGQDPEHELMELFARSLRDLGRRLDERYGGRFSAVVDEAGNSVLALIEQLSGWVSFADRSPYEGIEIPFFKRAQLTTADLAGAGVADFQDLQRLTMFADNLVPHVLRLDGILRFEPELLARIERGELIEHGSPEEVEIRACAVHAVELLVTARPDSHAAQIDATLWHRGQEPRYKSSPRHRCRCTAY